MAKITFDLQELLELVISNELLPRQVARLRVKGDKIHFVIKTNAFILPFIPASLGYVGFDGNKAIFELTVVSAQVNKAMGWLQQALELKLPAFVTLEYPKVSVDIDRLLKERNIRGIQVSDVVLNNGVFAIVTNSSRAKEM
jgi:hypothetical protein